MHKKNILTTNLFTCANIPLTAKEENRLRGDIPPSCDVLPYIESHFCELNGAFFSFFILPFFVRDEVID